MDGEEIRELWCLVDGDNAPFEVRAGLSLTVANLKEIIKHAQALHYVPTSYLVVWQLNDREPVEPETTLGERIMKKGDVTTFATRLSAAQKVSTLFPQPPPEDCVHIFVQLPSTNYINRYFKRTRLSPPSPHVPIHASPRTDTVIALYKRLKQYPFIQVRGTPASGKTVLAQLLADFISRRDPDVNIVWVDGWPLKEVKASGNYDNHLQRRGWVEHERTVFIFDEAQLTYEDTELWGDFFKSIHEYKDLRAILFASYGRPTSCNSIKGTNMIICDPQRVTLRHVDHEDGLPPAGLLLTRSEFDDLVNNHYHSSDFRFDSSFFDGLFNFTNGHVGAIQDFIKIIVCDDSYRNLKGTARKRYSWDSFLTEVDPQEFLRKLESSASIIGKGLPSNTELQAPETTRIFSAVLRGNFITDEDFTTDEEKSALQLCFHKGWLQADNLGIIDLPDHVGYFFPSPLHRWYVEWKLSDNLPPAQIQANSLLDFVIDAIRLFSPRILSAERRIGPSCIQRLPETLYQDELYRCSHILSKGSLVTFPEFGAAKGRADFYIPAKRWGIEVLRDGDQLANHFGRFSDEPGSYKTTLPLSDSIVIDCRITHPNEEHPNMPKLYHAVFESV